MIGAVRSSRLKTVWCLIYFVNYRKVFFGKSENEKKYEYVEKQLGIRYNISFDVNSKKGRF